MSNRLVVRLLAVVLPLLAAVTPTAAHAERVVNEDTAGDVLELLSADIESDGVDGGLGDELVPAPSNEFVDIIRTVVTHDADRLRVSVRYRDLRRRPLFHRHLVRVRTASGSFEVTTRRLGSSPPNVTMSKGRSLIGCPVRAAVDIERDTLVVAMPTWCVGSPRWVQVGVASLAGEGDVANGEALRAFTDDGHRDGTVDEERIAVGPKVRHG